MAATWKTVRVFISSTFRDMHAERNHLVRFVFPELKERCRKKHIHLIDVDLRWGVTEEDAEAGKALEICLDEIDSCRPYFIGILGHRYGFVPPGHTHSITAHEIYHGVLHDYVPKQIVDLSKIIKGKLEGKSLSDEQKNCLIRCYRWNPDQQKYVITNISSMEMKILQSVFREYSIYQRDRSFFFFRSETLTRHLAAAQLDDFFEKESSEQEKLKTLKQQIVDSGLPHFEYENLDAFSQSVLETLWERIEAEAGEVSVEEKDWLKEEKEFHELFMADRTRRFVGRHAQLGRMYSFCERYDDPAILTITGVPGCGKSALMARFTEEMSRKHPDWLVLSHFVGASPESTNQRRMLRRFCTHLQRAVEIQEEVPEDIQDLQKLFPDLLAKAGSRHRILLIIDAVNQLDSSYQAHCMNWVPQNFPANVRVVISALAGEARDALLRRKSNVEELIVEGLEEEEIRKMVQAYLREIRKEFPRRDLEQDFFHKIREGNPLYILVALEELRVFGKFEELGDRIRKLPGTVQQLFDQVLERIESDFNPALVRDCMTFIACGRHGMTAEELQKLLKNQATQLSPGVESPKLPDMLWSRLYRSFSSYLFVRSGVIDFFHGQLKEAVGKRYLDDESDRDSAHKTIADYFETRWKEPYVRALDELPHQRARAKDWSGLERILCDLKFIEAKCGADLSFDLVSDYDSTLASDALPAELRADMEDFSRFIRAERHILASNAALTFQQAANQPDSTAPSRIAWELQKAGFETRPWFRLINKPQSRTACLMTLAGHKARVEACAFSPDGSQIVSASFNDYSLKLWDTESGKELATLTGHTGYVTGCSFSPDGRRIVSGGGRTLKLWNAESGNELATLSRRNGSVKACAFSPDGTKIVSASDFNTLKLWDAQSGKELATLTGHTGYVTACSFSPDGRQIVSASYDKTLRLWDAKSGIELVTLTGHTDSVKTCAFSPDGSRILSGSSDKQLKLWDAKSGEDLATLIGDTKRMMAFSIDGSRIVSASDFKTLKLWDAINGKELATLTGHSDSVKACAFSPDCSRIISASWDKTLKLWDAKSGMELATLTGHKAQVEACVFFPDGSQILSASVDGSLKLWDAKSGKELSTLFGHTGSVKDCAFSPDGQRIVSASADRTLKLWDVERAKGDQSTRTGHTGSVKDCAFSPDGQRIVSASTDRTLKLWDARSGMELATLAGHIDFVDSCAYSPDGSRIVSASGDKSLKIWDAQSGNELATLSGHTGSVKACAFSPDGNRIISASWDKTLKLWDAKSGTELATLVGHTDFVDSCVISPDGNRIISISSWMLKLWDVRSGKELATLAGHADSTRACAFSPDGSRIVSDGGRKLKLWDTERGKELATLAGHTALVEACAFSPDGSQIVSASQDRTLKLWDALSGNELATLTGHTQSVMACSFSPDGKQIASVSYDKSLKLWDAKSGKGLCEYWPNALDQAMEWGQGGSLVVWSLAGFHLLHLENMAFGPPVVTPRLCDVKGKETIHVACPFCSKGSEVDRSTLDTVISCSHCQHNLKLNPFTITADWLSIEKKA